MKTLVLYFHPNPDNSKRTKLIVEALQKIPLVTVRNIFQLYEKSKGFIQTPEQIKEEQSILVQYEQIAFLFPMYWYTMPGIAKVYLDNVFSYGFGFASDRSQLKLINKKLIIMTSTGGPQMMYVEGMNGDPEKLMYPFKSACFVSGMVWKKHFFFFGDTDIRDYAAQIEVGIKEL